MKKASVCAAQEIVYCYDLIDCLQNSEEILKWLCEYVSSIQLDIYLWILLNAVDIFSGNESESKLAVNPQESVFPSEVQDDVDEDGEHFETNFTKSDELSKPRKIISQEVPNRYLYRLLDKTEWNRFYYFWIEILYIY